jgi:hypothetical protein
VYLVAPIAGMLKPEMAKNTLQALGQFVVDKVGGKMGFIYEDLHQECIVALDCRYQQEKARMGKRDDVQTRNGYPSPSRLKRRSRSASNSGARNKRRARPIPPLTISARTHRSPNNRYLN